jgi:hypothetical protein
MTMQIESRQHRRRLRELYLLAERTRPTVVDAKCPECGFRVEISVEEQKQIDPASRCSHPAGWPACPNLKPELIRARSVVR